MEALRGYRGVLHGEAVAMGMVFAARRSEALGKAPEGTAERLRALLERAALPTELPDFPRRAYLSALRVDKKKWDARIRFVVLRGIGEADTLPALAYEPLDVKKMELPPGWRGYGAKDYVDHPDTQARAAEVEAVRKSAALDRFDVQAKLMPYEHLLPARYRGRNERIDERLPEASGEPVARQLQ